MIKISSQMNEIETKRIAQITSKQRETKNKPLAKFAKRTKAQVNKTRIKEELIKQIM